mgnify:FL=1
MIKIFTGIVEETGKIESVANGNKSAIITIIADKVLKGTKIGDSIAVNGVCLTVTSISGNKFTADVMAETIRRSSLGTLKHGSKVNLERAMAADGRFGGHIVSGHIDGTGTICSLEREDNAVWVEIETPDKLLKYIVEKGSIAIDGISLTVASLTDDSFSVSVIPHTGEETTLLAKKPGDIVNLENDIVGKYVERLMNFNTSQKSPFDNKAATSTKSNITMDFLTENGF